MARGKERDSSGAEPGPGPRKAKGPGTGIGSRSNGPDGDIGPETRVRESRGKEMDRETPDCADPGHGHQRLARTRIKPWATDRAEDTTLARRAARDRNRDHWINFGYSKLVQVRPHLAPNGLCGSKGVPGEE